MPIGAMAGTLAIGDGGGARQFFYGWLATVATGHTLKQTIHKRRPDKRDHDSFPSSHTAIATHTATYLQRRYGSRYGIPAYVLATFVGYSRVYDDRHDEQDVIAGAVIGYLAGRYFTKERFGVTVTPSITEEYVGVRLSARF